MSCHKMRGAINAWGCLKQAYSGTGWIMSSTDDTLGCSPQPQIKERHNLQSNKVKQWIYLGEIICFWGLCAVITESVSYTNHNWWPEVCRCRSPSLHSWSRSWFHHETYIDWWKHLSPGFLIPQLACLSRQSTWIPHCDACKAKRQLSKAAVIFSL